MQSSSFFCEIKIWRGNFCRNRHIWTLGGTFDFFSFFHIPSICPNSEQPNFSQDISPFWQLNSEHGSFQLAESTKTLSFYWLSSTKRGFCICNLFIIRISISFFFQTVHCVAWQKVKFKIEEDKVGLRFNWIKKRAITMDLTVILPLHQFL